MRGAAPEPPSDLGSPMPARRGSYDWSELGPRVASGAILMLAALAVTLLGGAPFAVFWLIAGLAILWEWQGLIGMRRGLGPFGPGSLALIGATVFAGRGVPAYSILSLAAAAAVSAWSAAPGQRLLAALGVLYAGALVTSVLLLRNSSPDGTSAVFWLFAVVWGTDSMAFFGGRLIGGPRLAPRFSPSKTWAGFLVGVVCGSLFGWAIIPDATCPSCLVALGLAAGAIAQAGDLFESALKRRFGAKNSSGLIPGHGGVMDRLDGFIAALVFAASLGVWRFGVGSAGAGLFNW